MTSRKYQHSNTKNITVKIKITQHTPENENMRELLHEWGIQMKQERDLQMKTQMAGLEVIGKQIKDTVKNLNFQNQLKKY